MQRPRGDAELMTEKQVPGLKAAPLLELSATNLTSKCMIARIEPDDAMILAQVCKSRWITFSEGTPSLWRAEAQRRS